MEGDGTRMWTRDENDIAMHTEGQREPDRVRQALTSGRAVGPGLP